MVPETFTQTHHPALLRSSCLQCLYSFLLASILAIPTLHAQDITGLELIRTIEHVNYSIQTFDSYFAEGRQLIAYSNNSGSADGDTLVIYDFEQDMTLAEIPGVIWSYDIRFINSDHILFRNGSTLYRADNLAAPVVNDILVGLVTFTVSVDRSMVAMLRNAGDFFQVELADYDYTSGTLTPLDAFPIPDDVTDQGAKLSFSHDGDYIALSGGYENNNVYIINTVTGVVTTVPTPANSGTYSPAFYEQSGKLWLAVGGGYTNGSIEVIDVDKLSVVASIPVFTLYNYSIAFDQTQNYLVSGGFDGFIKLFQVSGTDYTEIDFYSPGLITMLRFTEDNQYVISGHGVSGIAWLNVYQVVREPSGISTLNESPIILYPNPTKGILYLDEGQSSIISIFDINGRQVLHEYSTGPFVNVSSLAGGLYFLKAESEREVRGNRFVKD